MNVIYSCCCVSLLQDYYKALEDADEKVQLANQIYDLVRGKSWCFCWFLSVTRVVCLDAVGVEAREGHTRSPEMLCLTG